MLGQFSFHLVSYDWEWLLQPKNFSLIRNKKHYLNNRILWSILSTINNDQQCFFHVSLFCPWRNLCLYTWVTFNQWNLRWLEKYSGQSGTVINYLLCFTPYPPRKPLFSIVIPYIDSGLHFWLLNKNTSLATRTHALERKSLQMLQSWRFRSYKKNTAYFLYYQS